MKTETVKYDSSSFSPATASMATSSYPFVSTETRTVGSAGEIGPDEDGVKGSPVVTTLMEQHGEVVTTQNITSKTRTVETVTVRYYYLSSLSSIYSRISFNIVVQERTRRFGRNSCRAKNYNSE